MKKIILLICISLLMMLIIPFAVIIGIVPVVASTTAQDAVERKCEYMSGDFKDATVNEYKETVKKKLIKPEYANAVLGIYSMDRTQKINTICNKINDLLEYVENNYKNNSQLTVPVYIQAFYFGTGYIDYLAKSNQTYSMDNAKAYQTDHTNFNDTEYQYGMLALSGISETCALGIGGLPLDEDAFSVSSGFPYRSDGTFHAGLDMAVKYGSNVYAVDDAEVIKIGTSCDANGGSIGNKCGFGGIEGAGNYVLYKAVLNNKSYLILSCHMSQVFVDVGDKILKGQQIGLSGNSGNSSGAHLHLEIHLLDDDSLPQLGISDIGANRNLINPCDFVNNLCLLN